MHNKKIQNIKMVKPTFICVGVQKSGTCSLVDYLSSHPDIYMYNKEPHFFDKHKDLTLTAKDIKSYEDLFKTSKPIVGEKTPSYCYLPFAINRIHKYNPNIKIIIILREPIARAWSHYNMNLNFKDKTLMNVTNQQINADFAKDSTAIQSNIKTNGGYMILRGYYDVLLAHIASKFPKKNIYIGIAEEIQKNKLVEYNKIVHFLGDGKLKEFTELRNMDTHVREYKREMPTFVRKNLYNIYKSHNNKLYKMLGRRVDSWEQYYSDNQLCKE